MKHLHVVSNLPVSEPTARELERIRRANALANRHYIPPVGTPSIPLRHATTPLSRDRVLGRLEGAVFGFATCLITIVGGLAIYIKLGA